MNHKRNEKQRGVWKQRNAGAYVLTSPRVLLLLRLWDEIHPWNPLMGSSSLLIK